jgi:hypothetical protein
MVAIPAENPAWIPALASSETIPLTQATFNLFTRRTLLRPAPPNDYHPLMADT